MRRALIVFVALVVVLAVAALVVPSFIDWNAYKPDLAERAEAETGRVLVIDGDIDFRLLPAPELSAREARLSNIAEAETAEMASLAAIEIRIAFLPLLRGDIRVERVSLVDPVVALERLADGRANWIFEPPHQPSDSGASEPGATDLDTDATATDSGSGLRLDALEIENGVVTFRDAASGTTARLDRLNANVSADSLAGPFSAEGSVVAGGIPIAFDLSAGAISEGQAFPVGIDVALTDAPASIRLDGKVSVLDETADVGGQLVVSADSAEALGTALAGVLGAELPPLPAEPFSFRTRIAASTQETALNEMLITLGQTRATGAVSAAYDDGIQVDVALSFNRIDLDRLLAEGGSGSRPAAAAAGNETTALAGAPSEGTLALPDDFSGSFNLHVEALTYNAGIVRQLSVSASALRGVLEVSRAAALLPGGSDVTVSGSFAAGEQGPEFSGRLEAASDNLRALLSWLAVDTSAIPAERLRKAVVGADLGITPEFAQISGMDLRVDSSRLTGEGSFAFSDRPSFSVDVAVDRFNADAYRPVADPADVPTPTEATENDATATDDDGVSDPEGFDADLRLHIDEFTYNDTLATGLNIDASLADGVLVVRDASIQDIGGGFVQIKGRGSGLSEAPVFTGAIEVAAENPSALFRFAEIEAPAPVARLSPLRLAGTFDSEAEAVGVDIEGSAKDTRIRVRGSVGTGAAEAPMNLALELTNQSLAALIGQVAPEPVEGIDGAVVLTGTITGPLEAPDVALRADLAGARLSIAGAVKTAAPIAFDLAVEIVHADMTRFLADVGLDYRPAAINLGALEVEGRVEGDEGALALSEIAGSVGPVAVIGALGVSLGGERPRISGNLRTSDIIVDLFLPVPGRDTADARSAPAAEQSGDPGEQGRWSTDPIDLQWLEAFDVDIALASSAIDYGRYRFVEPSLKLVLEDGTLDIAPLTGRLYGGVVEITARLAGATTPTVELALRLDDADLFEALIQSAQIDRATGRLAISAELSSEGASQSELISALAGNGRFSAREGTVRGVDLRRLSNRLKRLNEIPDYLDLIQASLSGGETAYGSLDGTFQISGGTIRTSDLHMILDGAEAEGTGEVDLPRWLIDLRTRARLVEHPQAPTVGLDVNGSLDSPRRDIRTQDLERYLAGRVGGAVLRKILPDAFTGDEDEQDQSSGAAPTGGDAVELLLKELLDRLGD